MYPDGKLWELGYEIEDPDDQDKLKLIKEMLDIQHWSNIKRMLDNPRKYGYDARFVSHAKRHKIVKAGENTAWIVPDDSETPSPEGDMG